MSAALKRSYAKDARKHNQPLELHYIGSGNQLERDIARQTSMTYHAVSSGKFRRYRRGIGEMTDMGTISKNIADGTRFILGIRQARKLLKRLRPDIVFVNGGYVGLPVGLAARSLKIPLVIHESDTIMGLTNRILARHAEVVASGFPVDVYPQKLQRKITWTGNMVDQAFIRLRPMKNTAQKQIPLILVLGGSSGARRINEIVWGALDGLTALGTVMHQTGTHSIDEASSIHAQLSEERQKRYKAVAFIQEDLPNLMQHASVVISRAGANSLFELATLARPTIIIPLANSANNHQAHNGRYLAEHHAAHVISESELTSSTLTEATQHLLKHPAIRSELGRNLHALATPNASDDLAQLILKAGKRG